MGDIATVGDHLREGYSIRAYCAACRHNAELDLEVLAARLGREHSTLSRDLAPKLRCSKCGAKRVSFTLSPPNQPKVYVR